MVPTTASGAMKTIVRVVSDAKSLMNRLLVLIAVDALGFGRQRDSWCKDRGPRYERQSGTINHIIEHFDQ